MKKFYILMMCMAALSASAQGERQVLFAEDFEWLSPWSEASGAGRTVEEDNLEAAAPQIVKATVDGVTALDALTDKGYAFHRVTTKTEGECIYLQSCYLKFGKTSYQAGLTLPSIGNIPAGAQVSIEFDWCPMRQGSGKIDPVNLILIVDNGGQESVYEIPTHDWANDHALEWIHAAVTLNEGAYDANTKITLRPTQWPEPTANRWFLDNIEVAATVSTGIESVAVDHSRGDEYYTIDGKPVACPQSGLYIVRTSNGITKKIIM